MVDNNFRKIIREGKRVIKIIIIIIIIIII